MGQVLRGAAAGSTVVLAAAMAGCHSPEQWHSDVLVEDARYPVFSPDGTKIAFESFAALVPIDANDRLDVYIYDRASGTTELVSVNGDGTDSANHDSWGPVFSPDGTAVAFHSYASDLGPTDTNGETADLYLRDLTAGETSLVSVNATGTDSGSGGSFAPVFTPDGAEVAFTSAASDITSTPDGNGAYDIFLRDLRTGTTELLSVNDAGDAAASGESWDLVFTANGTKVAFTSRAGDLGPADGNGLADVYLRNLRTGTTKLVSVNATGTGGGNAPSFGPRLVGSGSRVIFSSEAGDLGPTDTNSARDVYVRDVRRRTTELVSVNAAGSDSGDRESSDPVLSPDGRRVAFTTAATNLGPLDPGDAFDHDVYMRDLRTDTTTLVSANAAGTDGGNGFSTSPVFSPDGRALAFTSEANDLGPRDTNVCVFRTVPFPCPDVYVRNLRTGTLSLASSSGRESLPSRLSGPAVFNPVDRNEMAFYSWGGDTRPESIYLATYTEPAPG